MEDNNIKFIGKIRKSLFRCITENIVTDDVIITQERIAHIEERHPGDYVNYASYIVKIIDDPDYILKSKKPDTAILLKEFCLKNTKFQLILKLKTSKGNEAIKNSVITFLKINERTWNKYLRNKEILYSKSKEC